MIAQVSSNGAAAASERTYGVLMVGPYPPCIGGTSAFLGHLVPGLAEQGVEVRVINTRAGAPTGGLVERIRRLLLFGAVAVRAACASEPIVHCHAVTSSNLLGNGIVCVLARLRRKVVILTLHAGDLLDVLRGHGTIKHRLARWIVRVPHVVTAVTPDLAAAAESVNVQQVEFIANSFHDLGASTGGPVQTPDGVVEFQRSHRPLVVMAGAMQPIYGVDVLLGALERTRRTHPEVGAIIIAYKSEDPAYREEIDGLVASLSLESAVLFPQYLPDVSAVVAQADVSVRPCHQDGDSMAVREALALGVPVVASRVGFRPAGTVLFEPGDSADLAEKLLKVFSGPPEPPPSNVNQEPDPIDAYSDLYHSAFNTKRVREN